MGKKEERLDIVLYAGCFISVCVIILSILKYISAAPFGGFTLANQDAYIQYLDLFGWLKDILEGKSNIAYTFSKSLGGTGIAVFSYYLASPLNLLVYFFEKSQLNSFFDIIVMLKLALASVTCSVWLNIRFEKMLDRKWIYLLALGYALCQYNLIQSSNIMWLDGVILLPLMLLGIYRGIWKKNWWYLSVFCGISLIVNWYTGAINCLFVVMWAFVEMFLFIEETHKKGIKLWIKKIGAGIVSMVTGLLISMILFYPTVKKLQSGKGGFDTSLLNSKIMGNVLSVLPGFSIGANSNYMNAGAYVSLFCGSFAVVCCIGMFVCKAVRKKQKAILGIALAVSILIFYWQPCIFLFSMLREVSSYWYRYSYVGIIGIIFCAAFYCRYHNRESMREKGYFLIGTVLFSVMMILINKKYQWQKEAYVVISAIIILVIVVLMIFHQKIKNKAGTCIIWLALVGVVAGELCANGTLLLKEYEYSDNYRVKNYNNSQQAMIDDIECIDSSNYRITQLRNRLIYENHLTGTYNEALAFGYKSLAGYTSAFDMKQSIMLEKLGYRFNGNTYNIVNTSILSADALLGVKYVLTDRSLNGLKKTSNYPSFDGKQVYENVYSLPFAFKCANIDINPEYKNNPFLYQNELFSELLGENIQLYSAVKYDMSQNENEVVYTLDIPDKSCVLYGNLIWYTDFDGVLNVNNSYDTAYARWASPSVFDIPVQDGEKEAKVVLTAQQEIAIGDTQFYALDLDTFKYVTDKLKSQSAEMLKLNDTKVQIEVDAQEGEVLFTSIPMDDGWNITLNGKSVTPKLFSESLIMLSLEEGKNVIDMRYHIPGFSMGIIASIAGGIMLMVEIIVEKSQSMMNDLLKSRHIKKLRKF